MNLVQTVPRQTHQNIGKNIDGNSCIGRYSKGQISADNIGGLIYRSVSNMYTKIIEDLRTVLLLIIWFKLKKKFASENIFKNVKKIKLFDMHSMH